MHNEMLCILTSQDLSHSIINPSLAIAWLILYHINAARGVSLQSQNEDDHLPTIRCHSLRKWEEFLQELAAGLSKQIQVLGEQLVHRPGVSLKKKKRAPCGHSKKRVPEPPDVSTTVPSSEGGAMSSTETISSGSSFMCWMNFITFRMKIPKSREIWKKKTNILLFLDESLDSRL